MCTPNVSLAKMALVLLVISLIIGCAKERSVLAPPSNDGFVVAWEARFGGAGSDEGTCGALTQDGGYLLVGVSQSFEPQGDVYIVKVDSLGNKVSDTILSGARREWAIDMTQIADDQFVIAGVSDSWASSPRPYGALVFGNGQVAWEKVIDKCEFARSIAKTHDGALVLVGKGFNYQTAIIKTDAAFNLLWAKPLPNVMAWGMAVNETKDYGLIVVAASGNYGQGGGYVLVSYTDSSGSEQWRTVIDQPGDDWGTDVVVSADGSFIVCGRTPRDAFAAKLSITGELIWKKTYRRVGPGAFDAIIRDHFGGYILAGSHATGTENGTDAWVVKLDDEGEVVWEYTVGGLEGDAALSVSQTTDGEIFLVGKSMNVSGNMDMYAAKLTPIMNERGRGGLSE